MKKYIDLTNWKNNDLVIDAVSSIVEYLNNGDYKECYDPINSAINDYLDNNLIYYKDQWEVLEAYCTPQDANYLDACECFYNEIYSAIGEEE